MQNILLPQKKSSTWLHLLVYYLIIGSDCVLFCFNRNEVAVKWGQYLMVFVSLAFLVGALLKSQGRIHKKYLYLALTVLSLFVTALYYREFSGGYISLIALFTMGTAFFDVIDPKEFKRAFLNVMTVLCVASLITFAFSQFFLKLSLFPSIYNTNDKEFRFFFLSAVSAFNPERNFGVFTEPSRYQAYLNLALIFLLFDREKPLKIGRILLFAAALVTTFSTTGFLAFAVILLAFFLSPKTNIQFAYRILWAIFIAAIVALLFFFNEEFTLALIKITQITANEEAQSASTRFNSILANLSIAVSYFPLGTGIERANMAFTQALFSLGDVFASNNTMTCLIYFAKFGFIPGLYYFIHMVRGVRGMGGSLLLVPAFILMTGGISMLESILFTIIVFYPQTKEDQKKRRFRLRLQKIPFAKSNARSKRA